MIFGVITIFALLLFVDLPKVIRGGSRRELAVYCAVALVALVYMVQHALGKDIFNPVRQLSLFVQTKLGLNYEIWQGHS